MGYEIVFSYHEKNEDNKFDMETTKTFTKNVGRRNVEVSEEQVAAVVLGQLARRDIYISNVEIYEYAKKQVSYKETKGGIVIRGKKFAFDQLHGALKADDDCTEEMPNLRRASQDYDMSEFNDLSQIKPALLPDTIQMPQFNPALAKMAIQKPKNDGNTPTRYETYAPSQQDYVIHQKQGIKLTKGKKYPIFGETTRDSSVGPVLHYLIENDVGHRFWMSSIVFEPIRYPLVGEAEQQMTQRPSEGKLSYVDYGGGVLNSGMPVLRRN